MIKTKHAECGVLEGTKGAKLCHSPSPGIIQKHLTPKSESAQINVGVVEQVWGQRSLHWGVSKNCQNLGIDLSGSPPKKTQ